MSISDLQMLLLIFRNVAFFYMPKIDCKKKNSESENMSIF